MASHADYQTARDQLSNQAWRLNNLYQIRDKTGHKIPFRMNRAQAQLFNEMHFCNLVLKARQLGFTTFIQLFMLDAVLFNSNVAAATVAHTVGDAIEIFDDKVKFAYDNLPEGLKAARPAFSDSARKLAFENGSSIIVGHSLRSGTYQYLHISEFGKICAQYPAKAKEIRTGALNTVQAGQMVWIESTAEGREGDFFEMTQTARRLADERIHLTPLDYRFFFFPWWQAPEYEIDPEGVAISPEMTRYFEKIEGDTGEKITPAKRAWYAKKIETQRDEMKREFPSTPDEAFEASVEGAYYGTEMALIRKKGQIRSVPWEPTVVVDTFWDLGIDDETAIWFFQRVGLENRFLRYLARSGEGLAYYAGELRRLRDENGWIYGTHHLPHDVDQRSLSTGETRKKTLEGLGVTPIRVVQRTGNLADDIQECRNVLPTCWFDAEGCADGIKALDGYRKEFDVKLGTYRNRPLHNWASHGADGFRTFAVGWQPPVRHKWTDAEMDVERFF